MPRFFAPPGKTTGKLLPPPNGTYTGEQMMRLLACKPKTVSQGIVDSGDVQVKLKTGTPVAVPEGRKVSAATLKSDYSLTIINDGRGGARATLKRL